MNTLSAYRLLGLLCLIILFIACKGSDNHNTGSETDGQTSYLDHVTEEDLAKFKTNSCSTGGGKSQAFKIHPIKEMIISAPQGAFEENPNIHVRVATGKELQKIDKMLPEVLPNQELLWAYDIDCGLPSDSVLPGKYKVDINLKQLHIPEELYPFIRMNRMDDKGRIVTLNTTIKNGVITYHACQNSISMLTIVGGVALLGGGRYMIGHRTWVGMKLDAWKAAGFPLKFWKKNDLVDVTVNDQFGNFTVWFRFGETEDADRTKEYLEKADELKNRLDGHKSAAEKEYDAKHPAKYAQWLENQEEEMNRRVGRHRLYHQKLKNDTLAQKLMNDQALNLPQSIQDVIKGTRIANRFTQDKDGLGLNPLSYVFNVYVIAFGEDGEKITFANCKPVWTMNCFLQVNNEGYLVKKGNKLSYDRSKTDMLSVTMAHEIGHMYEMEYVNSVLFTDMRFMEAIGSVTEHWFAAWLKKNKFISDADTESQATATRLGYAKRDEKRLFCWPLALNYPEKMFSIENVNTFGGYMLGDFVQFLCNNKKTVNFDHLMKNYAYNKSFVQDMKDAFDIQSDRDFAILYEKFCWKYMREIVLGQKEFIDRPAKSNPDKRFVIPVQVFNEQYCVHRYTDLGQDLKTSALPYAVRALHVRQKVNESRLYNLFAVPSKDVDLTTLKFTFVEGEEMKQTQDRLFIQPCVNNKFAQDAWGVLIYRPGIENETLDRLYYIDVVSFYQPKEKPVVKGTTTGGIKVDLKSIPNDKLLKLKYLSGMEVVVENVKTGKKNAMRVPVDECGKTVRIPYGLANVDSTDINVNIATRWYYRPVNENAVYYSPATEKVNYKSHGKKQEPKVEPTEENNNDVDVTKVTRHENTYSYQCAFALERIAEYDFGTFGFREYFENHPVTGHFSIHGNDFTLSIPAVSGEYTTKDGVHFNFSVSSIHVKGKCRYDRHNLQDDGTGRMKPYSVWFVKDSMAMETVNVRWTNSELDYWENAVFKKTMKKNKGELSPPTLRVISTGKTQFSMSVGCEKQEWRQNKKDNGKSPEIQTTDELSVGLGYIE